MIQNLDAVNNLLLGEKPIFQLDAILLGSEIVLRPSPNDISTIIFRNIRDLVDRIKIFPRWMHGTCHQCKPVKYENREESVIFSFFEDIMSINIINEKILAVQETTQKLTANCWKYLQRWKKYGNLWRLDKPQICKKFAIINPTLFQYEEKFSFYGSVIEEIDEMNSYFNLNSVR